MRNCTLVLAALLALSCGDAGPPPAADGAPCTSGATCAGGTCLASFPGGGACASDCAGAPCPAGEVCRAVGDAQLCAPGCKASGDCRDGYACIAGACRPPCARDADCDPGDACHAGACAPHSDGKPVGDPCARDADCASRLCDPASGRCRRGCTRDAGCGAGETCWLDPVDPSGAGATSAVRPFCIAVRGGKANGEACSGDKQCSRGACILGVCSTLCEVNADCGGGSLSCQKAVAPVDTGAPIIRTCLVERGTLTVELGAGGTGPIGLPANTRGVNIHVAAANGDTGYYAGLAYVDGPDGSSLYAPPKTVEDYYALPLRYEPSEGTSTLLAPNAPSVKLGLGLLDFATFAESSSGKKSPYTTRVRIKLAPSPPTSGRMPLHVFLADLAGAPCGFGPGNDAFEQTLRAVFAQAGLSLPSITYAATSVSPTLMVPTSGAAPELDQLLRAATAGDAPDVLELVVIRRIYSKGAGGEVLGIAGGAPGATGIPGTPHSGAVVSLTSLCSEGAHAFALTAAHELGHTLGLFHNVEQDGHHGPIGDDVAEGNGNLMYWEESAGQHLSHGQATVLLANPAVAP